jgi:hypothetical protein
MHTRLLTVVALRKYGRRIEALAPERTAGYAAENKYMVLTQLTMV